MTTDLGADAPAQSPPASRNQPRKPRRKRGVERFEGLLDAAHELLAERDMRDISHYDLAGAVGCAPATVYHLFPSMNAVYVALAERYAQVWIDIVQRSEDEADIDTWQDVVRLKFEAGRAHYHATPQALKVYLGLGTLPEIRVQDRALNRRLGALLWQSVRAHFQLPEAGYLNDKFANALEINDTFWSLSYAQHGCITDEAAEEALLAVSSYLFNFVPPYLPRAGQ